MDPESEALVRQLHRELNGLTRRRESGSAVSASFQQLQRRRTKPQNPTVSKPAQQPEKQAEKTSSFEKPSSTGGGAGGSKRRGVQDSGASGSDGEQQRPAADAKPNKKQRSEKPKEAPPPAAPQQERKPHRLKQNADVKRPAAPIKVDPEPAAGTSGQVPEQPLPAAAAAPAKTAIEAAAAVAAAAVRLKAKAATTDKGGTDSGGSTGPRHVKCFYAGVRWGIMLPPNVLHSRSDLAAALNEAFEGEIVSCGRGERLTVVFLDEEGVVSELSSVRPGTKENVNKWRQLANRAHRVYVRPAG